MARQDRTVFGISVVLLLSVASAPYAHADEPRPDARPPYRLPRNHEINMFNEVGTQVWYAHMLVNPVYGTRSAYYGSDPDTVAHQLAASAVGRYELKSTEMIRIRLFDENPALVAPSERRGREFRLLVGRNYRLVRLSDGGVGIWTMANTGTVVIRNELNAEVSYDLTQVDSEGHEHRLTIDIAPGGTNFHNVRGTITLQPGQQQQRLEREAISIPITAGRSYVFRLDPEGRMTSGDGNWDLFPVE